MSALSGGLFGRLWRRLRTALGSGDLTANRAITPVSNMNCLLIAVTALDAATTTVTAIDSQAVVSGAPVTELEAIAADKPPAKPRTVSCGMSARLAVVGSMNAPKSRAKTPTRTSAPLGKQIPKRCAPKLKSKSGSGPSKPLISRQQSPAHVDRPTADIIDFAAERRRNRPKGVTRAA
jgi:hypothetical protein